MAIQIALQSSDVGLAFAAAYVRISRFSGGKERVNYSADAFASQEARASGAKPVGTQRFDLATADVAGDILPALYADLKTRPGYENAEDC